MSSNKADRVINVGPEGEAAIEEEPRIIEGPEIEIPHDSSPDEVIFLTHVLSLKTAALVHMGIIKDYGDELDLETAKQIIDTLEVLSKRTQGHLSYEESRHLEASIRELKVAYLSVSK